MTEILEETKYGLIINFEGNDRAFLSFQRAIKERLLPENPTPEDYRKLKKLVNDFISEHRGREKPPKDEPWVKKVFKEKIEHEFELRLAFLTDTTRGFVLRNPEQKHIYEAVRSNRREVTKADLDLPPPTSMEAQFAKQGYKPEHYTDGIDQVNEWAAVRKKLQELKANPYKTHIEYFADQVTDHIEHIKKGLRDYDHRDVKNEGLRIRDKEKQLGELAILEEEAKQAVSDKTVTYRWWLDFNLRLTSVMSGDAANSLSRVDTSQLNSAVAQFPLNMIIPNTKADMGIIAFNKGSVEGVHIMGAPNRAGTFADGVEMSSIDFSMHDLGHASRQTNRPSLEYSLAHRLFHMRLRSHIESSPPKERRRAEAVYFTMTHEGVEHLNISYSGRSHEELRQQIMKEVDRNQARLFRFSDDPDEKQKKVEAITDAFLEVYSAAQ